jgi:hypothetical protein
LLSLVASTRHAPLTSCVYLRLAGRPSAQFANSTYTNNLQAAGTGTAFLWSRNCITCMSLCCGILRERTAVFFFSKKPRRITTKELHTRTKFQGSFNKAPCSSFKKLVVSTPLLLQSLHTMSLPKSVPKGLQPQECKRTKLCEPPPVP